MHAATIQPDPAATDPVSTDKRLVARAASGETGAFESIMRRHNRLLFRSARGVVGDDAEAQDVVQDVFLKVCATRPSSTRGAGSSAATSS